MYSNFKEKAIGASPTPFPPAPYPSCCASLSVRIVVQTRPRCSHTVDLCCRSYAEYVKEAVQEDQAGNYQKAFDLYKIALEYFSTHLKYEKNPRSKAAISEKACWLSTYVTRHQTKRGLLVSESHKELPAERINALPRSSKSTWRGRSTSSR